MKTFLLFVALLCWVAGTAFAGAAVVHAVRCDWSAFFGCVAAFYLFIVISYGVANVRRTFCE